MEERKFDSIESLLNTINSGTVFVDDLKKNSLQLAELIHSLNLTELATKNFIENLPYMSQSDAMEKLQNLSRTYQNTQESVCEADKGTQLIADEIFTTTNKIYNSTYELEKDYKELTDEEKNIAKEQGIDEQVFLAEKQKIFTQKYDLTLRENQGLMLTMLNSTDNFLIEGSSLVKTDLKYQNEFLSSLRRIAPEKFGYDDNVLHLINDIDQSSQITQASFINLQEKLLYCSNVNTTFVSNIKYLVNVRENLLQEQDKKQQIELDTQKNKT